jgi:AcrR family transcriptional regulator
MTKSSPVRNSPKNKSLPARSHLGNLGTRDRLLDCALTLFAAKGYSATGTQEIIDTAGVTKPVLYHHFQSKEALFRELISRCYAASQAAWAEAISKQPSPSKQLRAIARLSFIGSAQDLRIPLLMLQTYFGPPIPELHDFMEEHTAQRFGQVVEIVVKGLAVGEMSPGDPAAIALLFCCVMDQHINILARTPNASQLLTAERADALVDAFLHGCGAKKRQPYSLPSLTSDILTSGQNG